VFLGGTATGIMGVFVMAPDGSGRTQISSPDAPATGPLSWSPDSTGVLHTQTLDGNMEIVVSRTGGSTFRRLTNNKAADQAASFVRPARVATGSKS
jgi:Tol biopolymer transport system component